MLSVKMTKVFFSACRKHISKARPSSRMMSSRWFHLHPKSHVPTLRKEKVWWYFAEHNGAVSGRCIVWQECVYGSQFLVRHPNASVPTGGRCPRRRILGTDVHKSHSPTWRRRPQRVYHTKGVSDLQTPEVKASGRPEFATNTAPQLRNSSRIRVNRGVYA